MTSSSLPPPKHIGLFDELFPPKPLWTTSDVPDLSGQTIIVTGGSAGIGKEMCRILLQHNAKVYLAARPSAKSRAVLEDIRKSTGKSDIHLLEIDLGDLKSVRSAAENFSSKENELHILVNNGGVMRQSAGPSTAQGYDDQFGVNVLGHYFLTTLLLPTLIRTAKTSGTPVRVVNVASNGHELLAPKGGIVWDSLQKGDASLPARKKVGHNLYGQSKLGNVLFSNELARRYGSEGIVSTSMHPGAIKTELARNANKVFSWVAEKLLLYDVSYGIITPLYAATSTEALKMNGEYLTAWARRKTPSKYAQDPELAAKLWKWCEDQVKGF